MNNPCTPILAALSAPFPPERVSWRVGSTNNEKTKGMALAYIDARDVMERLDAVFGVNWQCRYSHAEAKTVCEIGVLIGDQWAWRADGAGDSDVEAEKGALSDAFKRAAVKWGIGRYLYDLDSPWVQITQKGRSYVIADGERAKLEKLLQRSAPNQPEPAPVEDFTQRKKPPGITKARAWVSEHMRDLHACESAAKFMETVEAERDRWIKTRALFPNLWEGPDGSGLRGEALKQATAYECRPSFDLFLKEVEAGAADMNQQQAAQ